MSVPLVAGREATLRLRLERQRGLSGGAAVNQLDRADTLAVAPVGKENQPSLRKGAVSFRQGCFLNPLRHRTLYSEGDLDRSGRSVFTLTTASSTAAYDGLRLR